MTTDPGLLRVLDLLRKASNAIEAANAACENGDVHRIDDETTEYRIGFAIDRNRRALEGLARNLSPNARLDWDQFEVRAPAASG